MAFRASSPPTMLWAESRKRDERSAAEETGDKTGPETCGRRVRRGQRPAPNSAWNTQPQGTGACSTRQCQSVLLPLAAPVDKRPLATVPGDCGSRFPRESYGDEIVIDLGPSSQIYPASSTAVTVNVTLLILR